MQPRGNFLPQQESRQLTVKPSNSLQGIMQRFHVYSVASLDNITNVFCQQGRLFNSCAKHGLCAHMCTWE